MLPGGLSGVGALTCLAFTRVLRLGHRTVAVAHVWDLDSPGTGRTVPFGVGGEVLAYVW